MSLYRESQILYRCFVQTPVGFMAESMQCSKETCQCAFTYQNMNKLNVSCKLFHWLHKHLFSQSTNQIPGIVTLNVTKVCTVFLYFPISLRRGYSITDIIFHVFSSDRSRCVETICLHKTKNLDSRYMYPKFLWLSMSFYIDVEQWMLMIISNG